MAAGDIYQLVMYSVQAEQTAINVVHYREVATNPVGLLASNVAAAASVNWAAPYKAILPAIVTFKGLSVQLIAPIANPLSPTYSTAGAGAGTQNGDILPRQTCGITTWLTGFAGRSYRGRTFWPFPTEPANDVDGTPLISYRNLVNTIATAMRTNINVTQAAVNFSLERVIYSTASKVFRAVVTGHNTRPRWATQRRRGSFGRANSSPVELG